MISRFIWCVALLVDAGIAHFGCKRHFSKYKSLIFHYITVEVLLVTDFVLEALKCMKLTAILIYQLPLRWMRMLIALFINDRLLKKHFLFTAIILSFCLIYILSLSSFFRSLWQDSSYLGAQKIFLELISCMTSIPNKPQVLAGQFKAQFKFYHQRWSPLTMRVFTSAGLKDSKFYFEERTRWSWFNISNEIINKKHESASLNVGSHAVIRRLKNESKNE